MAKMRGRNQGQQCGFTLIEMLISMSMGLMIVGGISSIFISNSNVSRVISSQTEIMGDLYLASHLMQADLRESIVVTAPVPSFPADLMSGARKPTGVCASPNNKSVSLPTNYPASFPSYPYWDATSKTLTYQDMDGHTGIIQYQRPSSTCPNSGAGCISWLRPDICAWKFEELIRGMDEANGLAITISATGEVNVVLTAAYDNEQHQSRTLSLSFKTWPRN
ncbi:MAG: prepilin-type N-terminal cleavage/methylation domain-containing protein [Mariprofundus sp.]|nr:prepilin-type N-terminal cleavage/methylation domain-containing protein [Mariprofundus sp.]